MKFIYNKITVTVSRQLVRLSVEKVWPKVYIYRYISFRPKFSVCSLLKASENLHFLKVLNGIVIARLNT